MKQTLRFKYEDEVNGQPVGPVWKSEEPRGDRWVTLAQARREAKDLGRELEEV